jgi:hypothetical protein
VTRTPPQGIVSETSVIAAELRALRKGRGMGTSELGPRVGPRLRELAGSAADEADVRRVLAARLTACAGRLADEPRTAILASLALSAETGSMSFFGHRVAWLAARIDRDERTALRRIDDAEILLAEEVAVRLRGSRGQAPGPPPEPRPEAPGARPALAPRAADGRASRHDWGDAPDVPVFFGRGRELAELERWLVTDRCRIVSLTGMKGVGKTRLSIRLGQGGIGKTDLSLRVARGVEEHFDHVIWRRLLNAPKASDLIADLIAFLSGQRDVLLPDSFDERVSRLLGYLRAARCLVILDNLESILQGGENAGSYQPGYEDYGVLFARLAEVPHQGSFLLTSREKVPEVASRETAAGPVRSWQLGGLGAADSERIFATVGTFHAATDDWRQLASLYNGNPLALELAARHIKEVFHGSVTEFLRNGTPRYSPTCRVCSTGISTGSRPGSWR